MGVIVKKLFGEHEGRVGCPGITWGGIGQQSDEGVEWEIGPGNGVGVLESGYGLETGDGEFADVFEGVSI